MPQQTAGSFRDLCLKDEVSSDQHRCCRDVSKLAADGNHSHFTASCISYFWISLTLLWFTCTADLVHRWFVWQSVRKVWETDSNRAHSDSTWHMEAKWSRLSFTNICSHFCSRSYQPERQPREDCLPLAATQPGGAPGWHLKLRPFGFNSGHLFIDSWEAQLGEVLSGFLPCKGSTRRLHVTILVEVCLTPSENSQ